MTVKYPCYLLGGLLRGETRSLEERVVVTAAEFETGVTLSFSLGNVNILLCYNVNTLLTQRASLGNLPYPLWPLFFFSLS